MDLGSFLRAANRRSVAEKNTTLLRSPNDHLQELNGAKLVDTGGTKLTAS